MKTSAELKAVPLKKTKPTVNARPSNPEDRILSRFHRPLWDRFSGEQKIAIGRLERAGGFENVEQVIHALAETALFALGLDPLAYDSCNRLAEAIGGSTGSDISNALDDVTRKPAEAFILGARRYEASEAARKGHEA